MNPINLAAITKKLNELYAYLKTCPNLHLTCLMALTLIVSIVTLTSIKIQAHVLKDFPAISEEGLKEKLCHLGMNSVLQDRPSSQLFHDTTYKFLKENSNGLDLELDSAKVLKVAINTIGCHVVLEEEQGLRVFDLKIVKIPAMPLGMGISTITEKTLNDDDME